MAYEVYTENTVNTQTALRHASLGWVVPTELRRKPHQSEILPHKEKKVLTRFLARVPRLQVV